jgi:hypothetical protein
LNFKERTFGGHEFLQNFKPRILVLLNGASQTQRAVLFADQILDVEIAEASQVIIK